MTTETHPNKSAGEPARQLLSRRAPAERRGCCLDTLKNKERTGALKPIRISSKLPGYDLNDILACEALAGGMGQ